MTGRAFRRRIRSDETSRIGWPADWLVVERVARSTRSGRPQPSLARRLNALAFGQLLVASWVFAVSAPAGSIDRQRRRLQASMASVSGRPGVRVSGSVRRKARRYWSGVIPRAGRSGAAGCRGCRIHCGPTPRRWCRCRVRGGMRLAGRVAGSPTSVQCLVRPIRGRSLLSVTSLAGGASWLPGQLADEGHRHAIQHVAVEFPFFCLSRWPVRRWRSARRVRSGGGSRRAAGVRRRRIRRRSGPLRCSSPSKGAAVRSCGRVAPG